MQVRCDFSLIIKDLVAIPVFVIPVGITIVGRQQGVALLLIDPLVSRQHARIECTNQECTITDLNSANGTFLNDTRLIPQTPTLLNSHDHLRIGPFNLEFIATEIPVLPEIPEPEINEPKVIEVPNEQVLDTDAKIPEEEINESKVTEVPIEKTAEPETKIPEVESEAGVKLEAEQPGEPPPVSSSPVPAEEELGEEPIVPPGLTMQSQHLIQYLPSIYQTDFTSRFLGIFELIKTPIEWTIDNFDLFLDPGTAPVEFLTWLENWFQAGFGPDWSEAQRRAFLKDACQIYSRRGTRCALQRILEIYTGKNPEIEDQAGDLKPFTFRVKLPLSKKDVDEARIRALIERNKPAFTMYLLEFSSN